MKNIRKKELLICILISLCLVLVGFVLGNFVDKNLAVKNGNTQKTVPINDDNEVYEKTVEKIMKDMTVSDMVYQMMFVTPESITGVSPVYDAGEETKNALEKYPVGGIIYFTENLIDKDQTVKMIKKSQNYSKIPLFIAVDEEGGRVARLGQNEKMGTTLFPPMREIGETRDVKKAYNVGKTLANDLKNLGFNVDFAPNADVLINKDNNEIGDRSFGNDAELVADMVLNAVRGLEDNGVSATLKHFPGHGSTYANSHNGRAESKRTLEELKKEEFLPFISGIKAEVDFIMVSHMTLVNATNEAVPCSLSKEVITDCLINDLGFNGIVITDSMSMGAVTGEYDIGEAAVKAIDAGVDMILMTPDVEICHSDILKAIEKGDLSVDRIKQSVKKILMLKAKKGMID